MKFNMFTRNTRSKFNLNLAFRKDSTRELNKDLLKYTIPNFFLVSQLNFHKLASTVNS